MDFILPAFQRLQSFSKGDCRRLGFGQQGSVFETSYGTAAKVFSGVEAYRRELGVYLRLTEHRVTSIQGHAVPQLLRFSDALGIIEMSIVSRPFVLDFGKSRIDTSWEHEFRDDPHVIEERWAHWESQFESEQWPTVLAIYDELGRKHGVWLEDLHPGNIGF